MQIKPHCQLQIRERIIIFWNIYHVDHQLEAVQPVKLCKSLQKESLNFWTVALLDHYNFHCMRVGILVVMYARTLRYRGITPPVGALLWQSSALRVAVKAGGKSTRGLGAVMYSGNPDTVRPCPHNLGGNSADWTTSFSSPGFCHHIAREGTLGQN